LQLQGKKLLKIGRNPILITCFMVLVLTNSVFGSIV